MSATSTYRSSYDTRTMPEPPPRQAGARLHELVFFLATTTVARDNRSRRADGRTATARSAGRSRTAVSVWLPDQTSEHLKMQTQYGGAARHQPWDCSKTNLHKGKAPSALLVPETEAPEQQSRAEQSRDSYSYTYSAGYSILYCLLHAAMREARRTNEKKK